MKQAVKISYEKDINSFLFCLKFFRLTFKKLKLMKIYIINKSMKVLIINKSMKL